MIKTITLQNFQSHKSTHLELSPGVNIIIGPSDSGKTAIIRALRWVIFNRPQGDSFRSHWGGKTEVSITLEAPGIDIDPEITRIKDKVDEYIMNGMSFKAMRSDIPKEIQEVLNMNEVNIQLQLDSPFLLSETPGAVAQHFNKVAKLDKIDTGLQNIQSWIRQIVSDIKYKEEDIEKKQEELSQFDFLPTLEIDIEVLEQLEVSKLHAIKQSNRISLLSKQIQEKDLEIQEASDIIKAEPLLLQILPLYTQIEKHDASLGKLEKILTSISDKEAQIDELTLLINAEDKVTELLTL